MFDLSAFVCGCEDRVETFAGRETGYEICGDYSPKPWYWIYRFEGSMRFLISILHSLTSVTVPDPFLDVGSKSWPVVVGCDDCCCSFDTWMSGLTFGMKLAKNVLSKTRRNVDFAHIGPERVYEFPTVGNWIAFEFLVETNDEGILSLGDVDFLAIVSFCQSFSEEGINLLRLFEN